MNALMDQPRKVNLYRKLNQHLEQELKLQELKLQMLVEVSVLVEVSLR